MTFLQALLILGAVRGGRIFPLSFRRGLWQFLCGIGAILCALGAKAQVEYTDITDIMWNPGEMDVNGPKMDHIFFGDLRFEDMQYIEPSTTNPQLNQAQNILGRFILDSRGTVHYGFDIVGGDNAAVNDVHYGVNELFIAFGSANASLTAGRKLADWSHVDEDWHLGIWQPTFTQLDVLRPIDEGLTGFFGEFHVAQEKFLLFATPIFIPSMGPDVKESNNGSLTSDSRWYTPPSSSYPFQGVNTQIDYDLEVPEISKLIAHPGAALHYQHDPEGAHGIWWGASAGYKPMNAVLLKYQPGLVIGTSDTDALVQVSPDVAYHEVGGLDFGYKGERDQAALSLLADHPEPLTPVAGWYQQRPDPFQSGGLSWRHEYAPGWNTNFEYLRILGGRMHDVDENGQKIGALFDARFLFYNSASAAIENETRVWGTKITTRLRYQRDFDQSGSMFNGEMKIYPVRDVFVSLGLDVLSVDNVNDQDTGFLNQFRSNDRYYGGVSYVF